MRAATLIRDADEVFLDGARVGRTGSFLSCLERIRKTVREVRVPGVTKGTSISIGATFRKADAALYIAKSKGRDCSGIFVLDSLAGRSAPARFTPEARKAR